MVHKGTIEQQRTEEIMYLFTPVEGYNSCYYGKVRNGKTRTATADILELLKRGEIVYANWQIKFEDFDERDSFAILLVKTLFRKKYFFKYKKENFHYIDPDGLITGKGDVNIKKLNRLVGVHIFIDEGQWVLSSMDRSFDEDSMDKMKLILHGGHYCRSLNIITQRPTNISKNTRSQIHFWHRCVKRLDWGNFMIFQKYTIEDMKDDLPIEFEKDQEGKSVKPLGDVKTYFVNKKHDEVFKAYNTHAMRASDAIEEMAQIEVFRTTAWDRFVMLARSVLPTRAIKARGGAQGVPVVKQLGVRHLDVGEQRKVPFLRE